jgi:outer membrane lipoprotein-sorting protein
MPLLKYAFALAVVLGSNSVGLAQSAEEKGHTIAARADDLTDGYRDFSAEGEMILNAGGGTSVRKFDFKARRISGGNQSLLVFSWPGDIRDTGLLTVGATGSNDDQWIYLPAAHSVKRITASSSAGSFVGSEFAYEDMVDQDLEDYSYVWLRDEGCCHVVEAYPRFSSGYEKQVVYFDMNLGLPVTVEMYLKRGSGQKHLSLSGYRNYGGVWRPSLLRMTNKLNGRSTDLSWRNYRFNIGLDASEFTTRALERGE